MPLLDGETMRARCAGPSQTVLLTDRRVVSRVAGFGFAVTTAIPLACVDSVAVLSGRKPWLLALAALALVAALPAAAEEPPAGVLLLLLAAGLFALWWFLGKTVARVTSVSGKAEVLLAAAAHRQASVTQFVRAVENELARRDAERHPAAL